MFTRHRYYFILSIFKYCKGTCISKDNYAIKFQSLGRYLLRATLSTYLLGFICKVAN